MSSFSTTPFSGPPNFSKIFLYFVVGVFFSSALLCLFYKILGLLCVADLNMIFTLTIGLLFF